MYLKIESVSGVEIANLPKSHTLAALNKPRQAGAAGPASNRSQDAKIPVPLRQIGGGAAAAAAATAATGDAGAACTPDEIFCYTQFNSSRAPSYHFYPAPHYLGGQQSAGRARFPYPEPVMAAYNVSGLSRSRVSRCVSVSSVSSVSSASSVSSLRRAASLIDLAHRSPRGVCTFSRATLCCSLGAPVDRAALVSRPLGVSARRSFEKAISCFLAGEFFASPSAARIPATFRTVLRPAGPSSDRLGILHHARTTGRFLSESTRALLESLFIDFDTTRSRDNVKELLARVYLVHF